jgi:zinc protease
MGMLMRGTTRRSSEQLAFDLESLGALTGEDSGLDSGALSVRAAAGEAPPALEIHFEALREPAFDPVEHEIQRQEVLADLRMREDDTFDTAYRAYARAMFAGHGYGHAGEGEPETVAVLTPDDCRRWHAAAIRPETILFVGVGDFELDAWRAMLDRLSAHWPAVRTAPRPRAAAPPPAERPREALLTRAGLQQGLVVTGFRTPGVDDPDYPALRLASAALGEGFGGRLFTNLRDRRGLAYAVGSALRTHRLAGHQILYIGTKPETIDEARAGLLEEAEAIRNAPLDAAALGRAREYVIGKYLLGRQSLAQRAAGMAWWEDIAGDAALDAQWPARLASVTAEDIRRAAARWWTDPTTAVLKPK